jgi:hypothetical protein
MILVRDHGPRDPYARLVLHTLRSFMDDGGSTFVGQTRIADAACLSRPTVRKTLKLCWEVRWVGVNRQDNAKGYGWRQLAYRACVPYPIQIPDKHAKLIEAFGAKYGREVDTDSHPEYTRKTLKVGNEVSQVDPVSDTKNTKAGKPGTTKVGNLTLKGGKPEALKGPKVGNGVSIKCISEKLSLNRTIKVQSKATAPAFVKNKKNEEPEAPEARADRIRKMLKELPSYNDADLAKVARVTVEEVQRLRAVQ